MGRIGWAGMILMVLMLTSLIPAVSGMGIISFKTDDVIRVLPGDYSEGYLNVENPSTFDFEILSFRGYTVKDENGNEVDYFNLTLEKTVYGSWASKESKIIHYNVSCSDKAEPGIYTLYLKFFGTSSQSGYQVVSLRVTIRVDESPIDFEYATAYVKERPESPYALNGESIVVVAHLKNIGHRRVSVIQSVAISSGGKVYFSKKTAEKVGPGENALTIEVPVGMGWPEGTYTLNYTLSYGRDSYTYTREFSVKFGVRVVDVSVKSEEVMAGEGNIAYVSIVSERVAKAVISVVATSNKGEGVEYTKEAQLSLGNNVVEVPLPTNLTGRIGVKMGVSVLGRSLGTFSTQYTVVAVPRLVNVTYERTGDEEVEFRIEISNPNDGPVNGTLEYRIYAGGEVLYKKEVPVVLKPGDNTEVLRIKVPQEEEITYKFLLTVMGKSEKFEGSLYLPKPLPTTTSSTTTTSTSEPSQPSNTTTGSTGGDNLLAIVVVLVVLSVIIAAALLYLAPKESERKRRERPKPKRRSPLGRFRPPKPPRFRESRELPKR